MSHRILARIRLSASVAAALLAIVMGTPSAVAQSVVHGIVVEDGSRRPISVVDIRLTSVDGTSTGRAISDDEGRFRVEVADSGLFKLEVTRVGYASLTADSIRVFENDELELEIRLDLTAVPLDAVTVVTQRRAEPMRIVRFRERASFNQRAGIGRIYMREDLDRLSPNSAQEVLDRIIWTRCRPHVLLDGLPFEGSMSMVDGDVIEGIEIYRGITQIPIEYYRSGMCGLAMVWSRSDPPGMRPFSWRRAAVAGVMVLLVGLFAR